LITASQWWRLRPNFWNCTAAAFMLDIIQSNIGNCLITQLSMHLHHAFTKFCYHLCYELHTSWSLHHSNGRRPNFCNCTTATCDVTQHWCCVSINIVNCPITQLSMHLHPAFTKFFCCLHYESHTSWSLHHCAGRRPNFWNGTAAPFMLDIIQLNIVNCLITQLSMHLHPAFTKFCCRLHYESHTSWSLHHSAGGAGPIFGMALLHLLS
jgi:hypothetical protein